MFYSTLVATFLLATAASVSGQIQINNKCPQDVYIWVSNEGDCDKGPNGICYHSPGAEPWHLAPGTSNPLQWITNDEGTSIKIAKTPEVGVGNLQFEYTLGPRTRGMYWDLSNLDGVGAARVGSPFWSDNVKCSPTGPGVGVGTCQVITCRANEVCKGAYQIPDQTATNFCPQEGAAFTLDLCDGPGGY